MGDSTLVEFLRDISIIVAAVAVVLWTVVMVTVAILVYKKLNAALYAARSAAHNLSESGQAVRDSFAGKNPFFGIAAAGLGKAISSIVKSAFRR